MNFVHPWHNRSLASTPPQELWRRSGAPVSISGHAPEMRGGLGADSPHLAIEAQTVKKPVSGSLFFAQINLKG